MTIEVVHRTPRTSYYSRRIAAWESHRANLALSEFLDHATALHFGAQVEHLGVLLGSIDDPSHLSERISAAWRRVQAVQGALAGTNLRLFDNVAERDGGIGFQSAGRSVWLLPVEQGWDVIENGLVA